MSDLLIKPLRAYEDRGTIRDVDNEPYAAPVWLAKELEQLKLCEIVGEAGGEKKAPGPSTPLGVPPGSEDYAALRLEKKGQRWIIVDAQGARVGDFIGKREEAEAELAKRLAALSPAADTPPADTPPLAAGEQPPADQPPADQPSAGQPNDNPPQE
ncbi:hypothetical protein [Pseudomonas oryzihabitans]|uniref:Uncharacterized protein n=1 Tax=Pseudomonas oryzihabitans TaxID=47885 RepID=A0ABX3IQM4_9PSED|nr:hypothetical protein [Pseudomonas psychrotolerans]ONN70662.1 hypothetical protein BVL52_20730 [Pseudomonas psychrotolerans]